MRHFRSELARKNCDQAFRSELTNCDQAVCQFGIERQVMQLFRSSPKSDGIEKAEQANMQPGIVTDSLSPVTPNTAPLPPQLEFPLPQIPTPTPDQSAAPVKKSTTTLLQIVGTQTTGTTGTQTPTSIAGPTRGFVIIHAEPKRTKRQKEPVASGNHLNPRVRQLFPLLTILLILGGTLVVWMPLSGGLNNLTFSAGLSSLIQTVQNTMQIQAHQTVVPTSSSSSPSYVAPALPKSQYIAIAQQDAANVGISPVYFVNQINLESGFNPNAVSPGGAVGIAQFMPGTAAGMGINPWDPIQALKGAAQMMANAYHQYGDYAKALAAYNAGSASLQRAVNNCGASWLSCMTAETQHYVHVIMGI
jgi:hypothetical protein